MRELVIDAWRMCTPQMLHELPDLPAPVARLWDMVDQQEWHDVRPLLHPYVHFDDRDVYLPGPRPAARPSPGSSHAEATHGGRDP